jgi:galactokinase/mevalonate kinase-like predicted kinase
MYTPPARILFAGGDADFNEFVKEYVEHVLHIVPVVKEEGFKDHMSA